MSWVILMERACSQVVNSQFQDKDFTQASEDQDYTQDMAYRTKLNLVDTTLEEVFEVIIQRICHRPPIRLKEFGNTL